MVMVLLVEHFLMAICYSFNWCLATGIVPPFSHEHKKGVIVAQRHFFHDNFKHITLYDTRIFIYVSSFGV